MKRDFGFEVIGRTNQNEFLLISTEDHENVITHSIKRLFSTESKLIDEEMITHFGNAAEYFHRNRPSFRGRMFNYPNRKGISVFVSLCFDSEMEKEELPEDIKAMFLA